MIRAYYTPGYVFYTEFPKAGILIDLLCYHCGNTATLLVEEQWKQYRKIIFRCRPCNAEVGSARFKENKT